MLKGSLYNQHKAKSWYPRMNPKMRSSQIEHIWPKQGWPTKLLRKLVKVPGPWPFINDYHFTCFSTHFQCWPFKLNSAKRNNLLSQNESNQFLYKLLFLVKDIWTNLYLTGRIKKKCCFYMSRTKLLQPQTCCRHLSAYNRRNFVSQVYFLFIGLEICLLKVQK